MLWKTPMHHIHTLGGAIGEWSVFAFLAILSDAPGSMRLCSTKSASLSSSEPCWASAFISRLENLTFSIARKCLKWAEQKNLVDHDNFLAFGVGLYVKAASQQN